MSTKTDFNSTPLIVGKSPTTYGELRTTALGTILTTTPERVVQAAQVAPETLSSALRGISNVVLALLDVIEQQGKNNSEE